MTDAAGLVLREATVTVVFLLGDVTADRVVNAGDVTWTKARSGSAVNSAATVRADVNIDLAVNSGDALQVKAQSGTAVP